MSKTKVVIVTLKEAFLDDSGSPKKGRIDFGAAIQDELNGTKFFSKNKTKVLSYLQAMEKTVGWDTQTNANGKLYTSLAVFFRDKFNIEKDVSGTPIYKLRSDVDKLSAGIYQLMKKTECNIDEKKCYVRIEKNEYEIILLLWDELGRDRGERINPFGLFVEMLCEDCGIKGDASSMLYVHDRQLLGSWKDVTVLDESDSSSNSEFVSEPYFETLKKYFKYVATFGHKSDAGTFQNQILQFKFGPTLADKIAVEEIKAKSFSSLRTEAERIIDKEER